MPYVPRTQGFVCGEWNKNGRTGLLRRCQRDKKWAHRYQHGAPKSTSTETIDVLPQRNEKFPLLMLQHLLAFDPEALTAAAAGFTPAGEASAMQILDAKVGSAQVDPGAKLPEGEGIERLYAQEAFAAATGAGASEQKVKDRVLALRTPLAVRQMVGMLTAYDWEFVEQAKNIRSFIVTGLINEANNQKPEIRLKAYKMLGDVTEVALFTQRTEVVTRDLSEEKIEEEIRKRIDKFTINVPTIERIDSDVDDE